MIYITILYDLHKLYVTLCWKTLQLVGISLPSTQSTQQGITPLFWRGWRRRRQENFGILRSKLDGLLSKIDDPIS